MVLALSFHQSIYRFEVKNDTPEFVTPPFQTFLANAPRLHPRIYCFLDDRIGEARNRVTSHPEYAELQSRASQALKAEYTGMTDYIAVQKSSGNMPLIFIRPII